MEELKEKNCSTCKKILPVSSFFKNKHNKKHGLQASCKACSKIYSIERVKKIKANKQKKVVKPNSKTKKGFYFDTEDVWTALYNNQSIDTLYPDSWDSKVELDEGTLKENEEYTRLEGNYENYVVTSLGRIFSLIGTKQKQLTPTIHTETVVFNISSKRFNIIETLDKYGWSKTPNELNNIYDQHKFKYYKYKFESTGAKCIIYNK